MCNSDSREGNRELIGQPQHWLDDEDIEAVTKLLRSPWLTTGPTVEAFEQALVEFTGAREAVALSSGTAALHASVAALDLRPSDEVIVPTMTFVATASCVLFVGATPVFADVEGETLQIDAQSVEDKISDRTKAVIAMDYSGQPCDYQRLGELCNRHGLHLIADACHSFGASSKGIAVGQLADLSAVSFHPSKLVATGEGGAVLTSSSTMAKHVRAFRNHGIDLDHRERSKRAQWFYSIRDLGYNYRISDLSCALGLSQLKKAPRWLQRRQEIARHYREALGGIDGVRLLSRRPNTTHAHHYFVLVLEEAGLASKRDEIFRRLVKAKIAVNVHYVPVHLHHYYRDRFGLREGHCPIAENVYKRMLTLPVYPRMNDGEVARVSETVRQLVGSFVG